MRIKLILATVVLVATSASAGPVLLASFDNHLYGPGSAPAEPRVAFVLEVVGQGSYATLGENVLWREGDRGTVDFSRETESSFDVVADILTNGIDDVVKDGVLWAGGGIFAPNNESNLLNGNPDLLGSELSFVRLIVDDVHFEPYVSPVLGLQGVTVYYALTYELYGTPIPDGGTLMYLLVGCTFLLRFVRSPFGKMRRIRAH